MDYSDGLWKTVLKLVITNKWFIIIHVTFASILLTLHKVFKDDLNKKYERLCIYDLHIFLITFNLRFLYILILGGGGVGGVYTATEQFYYDAFTYIHSERAFIVFRPHLSSHDVWRHRDNKKWTSANIWSLCSFIVTKKRKHWLIKV